MEGSKRGVQTADTTEFVPTPASENLLERRFRALGAIVGMMVVSTMLDWAVYPLTYFPSDFSRHHIERTLLNGFDDTFMDIMVAKGEIKPATNADIARWNALRTKDSYAGHLAQYATENLYPSYTFIVLKPIRIPGGMYGGHSRNFIVPSGIAAPRDYGSHNNYYFMKNGSVQGPAAYVE